MAIDPSRIHVISDEEAARQRAMSFSEKLEISEKLREEFLRPHREECRRRHPDWSTARVNFEVGLTLSEPRDRDAWLYAIRRLEEWEKSQARIDS